MSDSHTAMVEEIVRQGWRIEDLKLEVETLNDTVKLFKNLNARYREEIEKLIVQVKELKGGEG